MQSKVLKIFFIIAIAISIKNIQVYALDSVVEQSNWPKKVILDDYEYIVEGFELQVYEFERDKDEENNASSETEDIIKMPIPTQESLNKYAEGKYIRSISIPLDNLIINPKHTLATQEEILNFIMVNMNLNITKEQLELLLSEEMEKVTKDKYYLVDMVMNYRFTRYPEKFKYVGRINFSRMLKGPSEIENLNVPILYTNITETVKQRINNMTITINQQGNKELYYTTELNLEEEFPIFSLITIADAIILSEKEININIDLDIDKEPNIEDFAFNLISFSNLNIPNFSSDSEANIKELKSRLEDAIQVITDNTGSINNTEFVNVIDTAAKKTKLVYLISIFAVIVGTIVIVSIVGTSSIWKKRKSQN